MFMWLQLIVPIVVSALISAGVPRRWLPWTIAAWVLSPAFVYWALIISELMTRPIPENAIGKSLFGFMLIASVVAIPWMVLCLIGFGLGFLVRRRVRPHVNTSASDKVGVQQDPQPVRSTESSSDSSDVIRPVSAIAALAERSPFISIEQASGWREAHIGFANSALRLDGFEVWKSKWRALKLPPVCLPHPAHPQQTNTYDIYEIGPLDNPVRFAAGELSNGVWGFYVPVEPRIESGSSADGSIRFIREGIRQVDGRDDCSGWIVLTETSTGRVLADCKSWDSSQVISQPDGSLFLRLQEKGFDALLRIAPVARCFSNLGEGGQNLPLSTLTNTLEQTLLTITQRDRVPTYRRISFDGCYRVDLQSVEWSSTHWVNSPRVIENATGLIVVDLWNTRWDATVSSFEGKLLRLDMRCYGRLCFVTVELDLAARGFRLTSESRQGRVALSGDLESLPKALADVSVEDQNEPAPAWPSRREQAVVPPFAAWRVAVMILVAAMVAIALVALVAKNASQPAPQKLDKVLPMQPLQKR